MEITSKTRISKLLKENPEALETLIGINKKFERLRNPLLRKLMAGRTSIKEAAKIGGISIEKITEALKPLGFEFVGGEQEEEEEVRASVPMPAFMKNLEPSQVKVLDVRPDIESGKDPLRRIMQATKELPEGHVLKIVNSFVPTPLVNVLEKKGFESYIDEVSADEVQAYFKPKDGEGGVDLSDEGPETVTEEIFTQKLKEFGEKIQEVDVSMMEMPMPMMTILGELEDLPEDFALSVFHRRTPVFLFNELKERNFQYQFWIKGDHETRLLIYR